MPHAGAFTPKMNFSDLREPGYEIWFAAIENPETKQALWVRYTVLIPAKGSQLTPKGVLWGSLFDANEETHHSFGAKTIALDDVAVDGTQISFAKNICSLDRWTGNLPTTRGQL